MDLKRDFLIDFVKGCTVGGMLLHHTLNYFPIDIPVKVYVRFVSGAFPFLSGFILTCILHERYSDQRVRHAAGMIFRGLKLPILFCVLNAAIWIAGLDGGNHREAVSRFLHLMGTSLTAGLYKSVAFDLLIPIGYSIAIVSFFRLFGFWRQLIFLSAGVGLLGCTVFFNHLDGGYNLRYITIGVIGAAAGCAHTGVICFIKKRWWIVTAAFVLYLVIISRIHVIYPVYVMTVLINCAMLYCAGLYFRKAPSLFNAVCLAGRYSLFAYLFQILVYQLLRTALPASGANMAIGLLTTTLATGAAVWLLDSGIRRSGFVKRVYGVVFK